MDRFIALLRKGQIGQWCKRGAWVIAGIGVVGIGLQIYWIWQQYHELMTFNLGQGPQFGGMPAYYLDSFLLTDAFRLLISITTTIFFFLLLFIVGVIADTFAIAEQKDSDIIIESIDKAEAVLFD